jgi:hypothetical protein
MCRLIQIKCPPLGRSAVISVRESVICPPALSFCEPLPQPAPVPRITPKKPEMTGEAAVRRDSKVRPLSWVLRPRMRGPYRVACRGRGHSSHNRLGVARLGARRQHKLSLSVYCGGHFAKQRGLPIAQIGQTTGGFGLLSGGKCLVHAVCVVWGAQPPRQRESLHNGKHIIR